MRYLKAYLLLTTILGLFIFGINPAFSQQAELKVKNPKATAILHRAEIQYENANYSVAAKDYEDYLILDKNQPKDVLSKLADCYYQMRANDNALRVYELLFKTGKEDASENQKIQVGELYARHGNYKQAAEWLQNVKGYEAKARTYSSITKLDSLKTDSLNWKIGFLNINTPYRDYSPVLVDNVLFFSSNKPLSVKTQVSLWDNLCYTSLHKADIDKIKSVPLHTLQPDPFLSKRETKKIVSKSVARQYEGADAKDLESELYFMMGRRYMWDKSKDKLSSVVEGLEKIDFNVAGIAFDRNSHVYFSANYSQNKNNINRLRIMEGIYTSNKITNIQALPFGDDERYSVMLPTVNEDGNVLVFCSDKPGGRGKMDLYYSLRNPQTKKWGAPVAFGQNINTEGNEVFPSITSNGYLYFSSDALPGLGCLDIYRIPLQDALHGRGEPEHLPYPINSSSDDFGWTQDRKGQKGFFSSDRLNNDDNLYSFSFFDRYQRKSRIEGRVVDTNKKPVVGATVFMLNKRTDQVDIAETDKKGNYHFIASSIDKVVLNAMKEGMTNDSVEVVGATVTQREDTVEKHVRNLVLGKWKINNTSEINKLKSVRSASAIIVMMKDLISNKQTLMVNDSWKLNNIHYDFNKWNIRPDAEPILDSLITILKMYPINIELSSYTDSRGSAQYNDTLSQRRAESVVAYLVNHGIERNRLVPVGYGERNILNRCINGVLCSDKEHQINRRTEVKVLSNEDLLKARGAEGDLNDPKDELNDKNALPEDNQNQTNVLIDSVQSKNNIKDIDDKSDNKFLIRFGVGEVKVDSRYLYILDELVNILSKNPTVVFQIVAQADDMHSDFVSDIRANLIKDYLVSKGINANRCNINESKEVKSRLPFRSAGMFGVGVNLDDLLLRNIIQSYKGDSNKLIIRDDNGNYCVQLGALKSKSKSQKIADEVQTIISAPVIVVEEDNYFKIRTQYSTNRNNAIETAAIIQASGILGSR